MNIRKHFEMLGRIGTDKVSGFKGVVSSISHDLYGCVQVILAPRVDKDGKKPDAHWFDVSRIELEGEPVMERPNWELGPVAEGRHGPSEKPDCQ